MMLDIIFVQKTKATLVYFISNSNKLNNSILMERVLFFKI